MPGETTETIGDTTYKIIVNAVNKTVDTVVTVDATKDLSTLIPENIEALGTVTYDLVSGDNITLAENGTVTGDDVSTTPAVVTATVKNAAGVTLATYTINILVTDVDLSTIDGVEINLWITNQPVAVNGWTAGTDYTSSAVNYFTLGADHAGVYSENGIALYSVLPNGDATTGTATVEGKTVGVYYWKNSFHAVDERNLGAGWTNLSESGTDFTYIRYWNNLWAYSVDGTTWVDFAATDVSATDSGEKQINIWFHQITEVTNEVSTLVTDWGPEPTNEYWTNQAIADFAVKYEDGGVTESDISMGFNIPDDRDNDTYRRDVDGKAVRIVYGIRALEDLSKGYEVYMITLTPSWIDSTTTDYGGGSYSNVDYSNGTEKAVWLLDEESLPEGMTKTTEEDMVSDYTACVVGGMPYVSKIDIFREQGVLVTYYVRAIETEQNTVLNVVWWDDEADTAISLNPMTIAVSGTGKTFASELKGTGTVTDGMNFGATGLSDNAFVTNTAGNEQKIDKNLKNLVVSNGKYRSGAYEYQYAEISPDGLTLTLHYDLKTGITFDPMYILDFGLPITFPISDTLGTYGSVVSVTMNNNGSFGTLTYDEETKKFTYVPSKVLTSTDIISITIQYMDENATTRVDTVDKNIAFAPATTVYYEEGFAQFGTGWDVITGGGWQNTTNKGTGTQEAHIAGVESNTYNNYGYDNAYAGVNSNTGATASTAADSLKFTFTGTGVDLFANCDDESGIVGVRITNANGEIIKLLTINTANTGAYATGGTAYNTPIASVDGLFHGTYTVTLYVASGSFSFDGFRVYNTIKASSTENTTIYNYYKNDLEEDPSFYELRDAVLAGLNVGNYNGIYASDIAASIYAQVYASNNTGTGALVLDASAATESDLANLLDNGPKNELYLTAGQSVTFKLNTSRQAQIGIRAVSGTGSFSIGDGTSVSVSSVDMFYDLQAKDTASGTVYTITNTGSGIISITDIKISDAVEGEIFGALTEEDITTALVAMGIPEEPAPFEPTISMKWLSSTVRAGFSGILTVTTSADVESLTVNGQALHCRTLRGMKIWTYVVTCSTPGSYTFDVVAVNADGVAAETVQTPVLTVTRSILHSFFERFF